MITLALTIPGVPPSVNHQYVRRPTGGVALTREARAYKQTAREYAAVVARQQGWRCVPVGEQVIVRLWYYWPDKRRRDTQNNKLLFDALENVVYEDDGDVLPRVMGGGGGPGSSPGRDRGGAGTRGGCVR